MSISSYWDLFFGKEQRYIAFDHSKSRCDDTPSKIHLHSYGVSNTDGHTIELIRISDQIFYRVLDANQVLLKEERANLNIGDDPIAFQPIIGSDYSVHFESKQQLIKSKRTSTVTIDQEHWAITLIDNASCNRWDVTQFLRAAGHISILIEGVKEQRYFMQRAHLKKGEYDLAEIDIQDEEEFLAKTPVIYNQSETWQVKRNNAESMIENIKDEKLQLSVGIPCIHFSFFVLKDSFLELEEKRKEFTSKYKNCFTWAREKLALAGIDFFIPGAIFPSFISIPKRLIHPSSIYSKQRVRVFCKLPEEDLTLDLTEAVHSQMKGHSWKVLASQQPGMTPNVVSAVTKAYLKSMTVISENLRYVICQEEYSVLKTEIVVTIQGTGTKVLDMTQAVKNQLEKRLGLGHFFEIQKKARRFKEILDDPKRLPNIHSFEKKGDWFMALSKVALGEA